ncbi:MAG: hypothetical protein IT560_00445 [Alphaproteobacteria bacterium]|nr:hypothetical protein [Alphaproteobacteria bacterium]
MKRYGVLLEGINFQAQLGDSPQKLCFFTTRFVSASDEIHAAERAKTLVLNELSHRLSVDTHQQLNAAQNPASLIVEKVYQAKWHARMFSRQRGFTFYAAEDDNKKNSE